MERRKAIKLCCHSAIAISTIGIALPSCTGIYYASSSRNKNRITISKAEFLLIKKDKSTQRSFVLLETVNTEYPICLYKHAEDNYSACLLKCTHRSCELNVGGGIYSCPCHGSEFSTKGQVLEGPALEDLTTYQTETDHENIYISL